MRQTNILEKLGASAVNALIVIAVSLPFWLKRGNNLHWSMATASLFFLYEMLCAFAPGKRDIGMLIFKSYWEKEPSLSRYVLYNLFYTLSFATLLFYIWFPFDVFLINLCFVQLPMILVKHNSLHGYFMEMVTIKNPSAGFPKT